MTTKRRSRRGSTRTRRKRTLWENLSFLHSHIAAASVVFSDLTPEPMQGDDAGVAKCLRIIGNVTAAPDAGSLLSDFNYAIGIAVVTADAIAAGTLPDPFTDFQQSWYYWTKRSYRVGAVEGRVNDGFDFQVRTQRLLRSGYRLVLVSETVLEDQAQAIRIHMRNLWELD